MSADSYSATTGTKMIMTGPKPQQRKRAAKKHSLKPGKILEVDWKTFSPKGLTQL